MIAERLAPIIDGARTINRLDWASARIWQAYAAGEIGEGQTQALADRIAARKVGLRPVPRQVGGKRITVGEGARHSIFPQRKSQRSPDRKASLLRRRRMASSGPLPPQLAAHFTTGHLAVMRVISDEMRDRGKCAITIAEIAARAGVCRALVQQRRQQGRKNLPNLVRVISIAWLAWIRRGPKSSPMALSGQGIGSIFPDPTNTSLEKGFQIKSLNRHDIANMPGLITGFAETNKPPHRGGHF